MVGLFHPTLGRPLIGFADSINPTQAEEMNRSRSLVVALTRFFGILRVFFGLITCTYAEPYYHRYLTVFARPEDHRDAVILFALAVLQGVLHLAVGIFIFAQAEHIIDALRVPEAEPGLRSLIVAFAKMNGFILFFYAGMSVLMPSQFVINFAHNGWSAMSTAGPQLLRVCLNLMGGFLIVTYADRLIDRFDREHSTNA
jgi:hypothetical protein